MRHLCEDADLADLHANGRSAVTPMRSAPPATVAIRPSRETLRIRCPSLQQREERPNAAPIEAWGHPFDVHRVAGQLGLRLKARAGRLSRCLLLTARSGCRRTCLPRPASAAPVIAWQGRDDPELIGRPKGAKREKPSRGPREGGEVCIPGVRFPTHSEQQRGVEAAVHATDQEADGAAGEAQGNLPAVHQPTWSG